ncbi:MAG: hypothetical protein A3H98_08240 [Bacteroidetes bacterium RIFCSPLOWO2_02_FULL_36_8]|nr:MAG: hypothetical protein A3H98_08240 [Bacteroidetes bacterium RIFCSPLOWO2_02_FULL_36_8]OFY68888.1 MAG: hypothetical protein A3G23_03660 [Bacteroidetes bacterium RIFCSPLOWO2_12_FULL_37_12]
MAEKKFEDDDPMLLNAVIMEDVNPEIQVKIVIEEFIISGFSKDEIFSLFTNPFYRGANLLYKKVGKERVEEMIKECFGNWKLV